MRITHQTKINKLHPQIVEDYFVYASPQCQKNLHQKAEHARNPTHPRKHANFQSKNVI